MNSVRERLRKPARIAPPTCVDHGDDVDSQSPRRRPTALRAYCSAANRRRALDCYRQLASAYDLHTRRIERIQHAAIQALALRAGEKVLDVACGTGKCLPQLAACVGGFGTVIGVEQCPEMADSARRRCDAEAAVRVIETPVEEFETGIVFDAVLMSFTQDVLQTPAAVARVLACCRPGARVAIAGMRFLPWGWGAPINLYNAWRARHYMTTFKGLRAPWQACAGACPDMAVRQTWFAGSCYLALGRIALSASGRSRRAAPLGVAGL